MKSNRLYKYSRLMSLFLSFIIAITFSGCDSNNDSDKNQEMEGYVYYINKGVTKIVQEEYEFASSDENDRIEELVEQLNMNTADVDVTKAIPDGVKVMNYSLEEGIFTIDFNSEYLEMSKTQEVLTRAAVVLTMTQLEGIGQVAFTVAGEGIKNSTGAAVGYMDATDFADNLDSNKTVYNTETFTIYFSNTAGTQLVPYVFEGEYSSNVSKEQYILNKLIEGPGDSEGYVRTVPETAKVSNVYINYNTCYVVLEESFLTAQTSVPDDIVIYSIVNSLSEIPYISQVHIRIKGAPDNMYHGTISLDEPFTMNLDIIAKEEETN